MARRMDRFCVHRIGLGVKEASTAFVNGVRLSYASDNNVNVISDVSWDYLLLGVSLEGAIASVRV